MALNVLNDWRRVVASYDLLRLGDCGHDHSTSTSSRDASILGLQVINLVDVSGTYDSLGYAEVWRRLGMEIQLQR